MQNKKLSKFFVKLSVVFVMAIIGAVVSSSVIQCSGSSKKELGAIEVVHEIDNNIGWYYAAQLIDDFVGRGQFDARTLEELKQYRSNIANRKQRAKEEIIEVESKIIVAHYPKANFKFYFQLAYLYDILDDRSKALEYYNRSIELKDTNSLAYIKRGQLYQRLNKLEDYQSDTEKAYQLAPHDPLAIMNKAVAALNSKNISLVDELTLRLRKKHQSKAMAVEYLKEYFKKYDDKTNR